VEADAAIAGGILPDVEVPTEPGTRYAFELVRQNHFFTFAVDYSAANEIPRDFRATPAVVDAFRTYLEESDFDYETEAQLQIDRLRELGKQDGYDAATLAAIDALEARVEAEKRRDFERNLDYVIFGVEREIQSKVWGVEAAYEVSLRNDKQFDAAVALLNDRDAYLAALEGKEPVKSVGEAKADMAAIAEGDPGFK
jgi:carboxyl-terminal processing protease